jgi:hypothetical protein
MLTKYKLCLVKEGEQRPEGVIPFRLTQKIVDRDSEVILPRGAQLENYKKNPVFQWAHDLRLPPIGRIIPDTLVITEDFIDGDAKFDLEDPFAKMIYNKYKNKFLNAGSIRFIPIERSEEQVLEGQKGSTYTKWELLEFSAVPVPANPEARQRAIAKATSDDDLPWYDLLKEFFADESIEHTPAGWVDRLNKGKGNQDPGEEDWDGQKPYPNEHACRLKDPGQYARFRRGTRDHEGKKFSVIWGVKQDGTVEEQAYRYPKDAWAEGEARAHCKSHNGISFEPASGKTYFASIPGAIEYMRQIIQEEIFFADKDPAVPFLKCELIDENVNWDQGATLKRIDEWADGDMLKRSQAFALIMKKNDPLAYRLLHHDIAEGKIVTVWRGVADAMIQLFNFKNELDAKTLQNIYEHLKLHYIEFNKQPPDLNKPLDGAEDLNEEGISRLAKAIAKAMGGASFQQGGLIK